MTNVTEAVNIDIEPGSAWEWAPDSLQPSTDVLTLTIIKAALGVHVVDRQYMGMRQANLQAEFEGVHCIRLKTV